METAWMVMVIVLLIFIFLQALANIHMALRLRRLDKIVSLHLKHHAETFGDYLKKATE